MAEKKLFVIDIDDYWVREVLLNYNDLLVNLEDKPGLTEEQQDEIIERVFDENNLSFSDWFEMHNGRRLCDMYDILDDAVRGYIDHVASDLLPMEM